MPWLQKFFSPYFLGMNKREQNRNAPGRFDAPGPFFSSRRERRLWLWTLIVVFAIYSTLGLASTLANELLDRGLFDGAFILAFFMIWAAILTQGLRSRPGGVEISVAFGVAAVYLMVFARLGIPERTHLFEYSVVAVLIHGALKERVAGGRRVPLPALLAIFLTSLVGALDECIQEFLPSRVFDTFDILFNVLAAVMAVTASVVLGWARRFNPFRNSRRIGDKGLNSEDGFGQKGDEA